MTKSKTLWPRKTKLVNFRITEGDYRQWVCAAKKESKSLAQLMREGMMLRISPGECRDGTQTKTVKG
jgi:hypothetical protein